MFDFENAKKPSIKACGENKKGWIQLSMLFVWIIAEHPKTLLQVYL